MWPSTDPLGHAGLTVAAVFAANFLLVRIRRVVSRRRYRGPAPVNSFEPRQSATPAGRIRGWPIDYRLVIVGSLLPDLLDKSFGLLFLPEIFNPSGRLIGHTLMFHIFLIGFSLFTTLSVRFAQSPGLSLFSLASVGHLIMDRMWESPRTLYWPVYGLAFGGAEFDLSPDWLQWIQIGGASIFLDGTGALVLVLFALWICRRGAVLQWLKTGQG